MKPLGINHFRFAPGGQSCADMTGYFSWLVCTNPHANLAQVSKMQSSWSGRGKKKEVSSLNDKSFQQTKYHQSQRASGIAGSSVECSGYPSAQDRIFCNTISSSVDAIPLQQCHTAPGALQSFSWTCRIILLQAGLQEHGPGIAMLLLRVNVRNTQNPQMIEIQTI